MAERTCEGCDRVIAMHGNAKFCSECRELFHLTVKFRKLKRKVPRVAWKRVLARVKYLEVLEVMGGKN